jgi:hypothetical protein
MSNDTSLFSTRLLALWVALGVIAFGLTLWLMTHQEGQATVGPSTFSTSAIGHAGIAETLERLHVPVVRSTDDSVHKLRNGGVLVLAEPEGELPQDGKLQSLLHAKTVLLVLPKWVGRSDRGHAGWIELAVPLGSFRAQSVLDAAVPEGEVVRADPVDSWSVNELGLAPKIEENLQLVKSDKLKPLVATGDGILLGELKDGRHRIWVLADPDVIANHGLAHGNADFAVALFQRLRGDGNVVFDETIHGFEPVPRNPVDLMLKKRFVPVVLEGLAAMLLLLWATIGRFGAPETAPLPLLPGKQNLIRNMATLMEYAGYQPVLVRRYVEATIRNAALQLHAPRGLGGPATLDWLQRLSSAAGGRIDAVAISRQASALAASGRKDLPQLFGVARAIRQWKNELAGKNELTGKQERVNGPSGGTPDRGEHSRRSAQGGGRPG